MFIVCRDCLCDGSMEEIILDENGVCNFCLTAQRALIECEKEKPKLEKIIDLIKKDGKEYDCLIGLSGGVDSSMVLHHSKKLGLKPLCFTMDNGYNDPKADANILQMVEKLKVPLYRYVLDLEKFRDVQSAYLKAGVVNVEAIYDHLLWGASYEMAEKYGIKWILSGGNTATESIMPKSWSYDSRDLVNLKDIYKKVKGKEIRGEKGRFPLLGIWKFNWYRWFKGIKTVYLLDFLDYNRKESIELLKKEYGYNEYGLKHEENIFTSWFQNFYLFEKFGIDKRKAHYSSMINSGQMTKHEALLVITDKPVYPGLGIEDKVMKYPKRKHTDFKVDVWYPRISKLISKLYKYGLLRRISNNVI